jgi:hypothetical protein
MYETDLDIVQKCTGDILEERGNRYGEFREQAIKSQSLKNYVLASKLPEDYMNEAMEMILHKIARIANGDPMYVDSWRDIGAYAELVVKELSNTNGASDAQVNNIVLKDGKWVYMSK